MKTLNRRKFLTTTALGTAGISLALPQTVLAEDKSEKKHRFRMQTYWGRETNAVFKTFTDNVKTASNDSLRVKVYNGGVIVPDLEMLTAVSKGTLDLCESSAGYWPGKMDTAIIETGMPGAWSDYDEATYLFKNGLADIFTEAYAEVNVKYLGFVMGGPFNLLTKKPVTGLDDLKNMKIRATPNVAKILQQFNIPTVFMPGSELYVGLSTGAIDGVIYGGPNEYVGMKLFEVAKYYTKLNMINPGYVDCVLMNMDKWNSLTAAQQKIMELATAAHAENMHTYLMSGSFNPEYTEKFEFSSLSDSDSKRLRQAAKKLWDEEAKKSVRSQKAVDMLKAFNQ